jgi:hypothetical protein
MNCEQAGSAQRDKIDQPVAVTARCRSTLSATSHQDVKLKAQTDEKP